MPAAVDSGQDLEASMSTSREVIVPEGTTPSPILSPGIRVGDLLWTAGHVGRNPETGVTPDGIKEQTRQTLLNLQRVLEAGGSSLANVIKVNIFLVDVNDRPALNEVYAEFFPSNPPGRTCFGGAQFDGNVLVEIECVAKVNS
jgi:2-iminobutanoate/2-iminopropanoate deaminase